MSSNFDEISDSMYSIIYIEHNSKLGSTKTSNNVKKNSPIVYNLIYLT